MTLREASIRFKDTFPLAALTFLTSDVAFALASGANDDPLVLLMANGVPHRLLMGGGL